MEILLAADTAELHDFMMVSDKHADLVYCRSVLEVPIWTYMKLSSDRHNFLTEN